MKPTDHTERDGSPTVQTPATDCAAAAGRGPAGQRGPSNNPSMRDGDPWHGNSDYEPDTVSTDADVGDMTGVLDDEPPEEGEEGMEAVTDDEPDPADLAEVAEDADVSAEELIAADEHDMHDLERAGPTAEERAAHDRTDASAERVMSGGPAGAGPKRQREFRELAAEFEAEGRYPGREEEVTAQAARPRGDNPDRGLPIAGYQRLTVPQVIDRLADLSADQVAAVREYERTHRNRKTLMAQLDRHLSGSGRRQTAGSGQ
jgi:hypothetical protein